MRTPQGGWLSTKAAGSAAVRQVVSTGRHRPGERRHRPESAPGATRD